MLAVVEVALLGADDLVGLVPLPGDHDHVVRRGVGDGAADRLGAVGDDGRGVGVGEAGADLGEDGVGVFGARVVVREDHAVGGLFGDAAHHGALGAVAVAAAADDAGERGALGHHVAHGAEHVLERVRRVGVVHDGDGAVPGADRFEAAGRRRSLGERVEHGVFLVAERAAHGVRGGEVVGVERAGDPEAADLAVEPQAQPVGRVRFDLKWNVGGGTGTRSSVGHGPRRRPLHHRPPGRVVPVDDSYGVSVEAGEQHRFRVAVGLGRAVVIEVVVGEVGENGGGEALAADALLDERVARHLHRARGAAVVHHLAEERVQRERVRRRVCRLDASLADADLDGAEEAGLRAERRQEVVEQVRRRRLAIRPRHPDELQLAAGVIEEDARHLGEGRPRVRDGHEGDPAGGCFGRRRADHCRRPVLHSLVNEQVPVGLLASNRDEAGSGLDGAAVVRQAVDRDVKISRGRHEQPRFAERGQQAAKRKRLTATHGIIGRPATRRRGGRPPAQVTGR